MGNHARKRTFYTDEECAIIVGNYRLTDGYERDYATRLGIEAALLSHLKKRAVRDGLRKKFPEHFGDPALGISRLQADTSLENQQLREENEAMKAANIRLANQLEKAKRRLGKAVSLLLDEE